MNTKNIKIVYAVSTFLVVSMIIAFTILNNKVFHLGLGLFILVEVLIFAVWIAFCGIYFMLIMEKVNKARENND